jgi:Fe-S oxidoreductase
MFIAEHALTPDTFCYEAEILDTGTDGNISIGLCSKQCPLDVHIGCVTESVGLTMDDGRFIAVCNI